MKYIKVVVDARSSFVKEISRRESVDQSTLQLIDAGTKNDTDVINQLAERGWRVTSVVVINDPISQYHVKEIWLEKG